MGFFSYECKACGHSILSSYSTDPEINEWMKEAVVLARDGSRVIGQYDGYGRVGGHGDFGYSCVWMHKACWELAGKPEFEDFDGPSDHAGDQGFFFKYENDMIDPRITDETERTRLLEEGKAAREKRWYDGRARKVFDWLDPEEQEYEDEDEEKREEPWRHRFGYSAAYEKGEELENEWWLRDKFDEDDGGLPVYTEDGDLLTFKGTEAECKAHIASLWAEFIESDECAAYLARAEELRAERRAERLAQLKAEGRYRTTYGEKHKNGERIWPVYQVLDELTYTRDDEEFIGNGCKTRCQAKADRMNEEWAEAGYPGKEDGAN